MCCEVNFFLIGVMPGGGVGGGRRLLFLQNVEHHLCVRTQLAVGVQRCPRALVPDKGADNHIKPCRGERGTVSSWQLH